MKTTELKVGDKVRVIGGKKIGEVKALFEAGSFYVTVAWPIPGKMFPVQRMENVHSLQVVGPVPHAAYCIRRPCCNCGADHANAKVTP